MTQEIEVQGELFPVEATPVVATKCGPLFIGIGHKQQQGKDTLARFLAARLAMHFGLVVQIQPFAAALKAAACAIFNIDLQLANGSGADKRKPTGVLASHSPAIFTDMQVQDSDFLTIRQLLQLFGVSMREAFPGCWVNAVMDRKYDPVVDVVLIPDMRFEDEAEAVKAHSGLTVRVERPGFRSRDTHESETALDGWDGWDHEVIASSLEELGPKANALADRIANIVANRTAIRGEDGLQ